MVLFAEAAPTTPPTPPPEVGDSRGEALALAFIMGTAALCMSSITPSTSDKPVVPPTSDAASQQERAYCVHFLKWWRASVLERVAAAQARAAASPLALEEEEEEEEEEASSNTSTPTAAAATLGKRWALNSSVQPLRSAAGLGMT